MLSLETLVFEEYANEIFEYLMRKETKMLPDSSYMDKQRGLDWGMRTQLVAWLVKVRNHLGLDHEVLYLTVNIIDRSLSLMEVTPDRLMLLAAASLIISLKYEQQDPDYSMQDIIKIIGLEPEKVRQAERIILRRLDYDLGWPGPSSFLQRINKINNGETQLTVLAHYVLEVMLRDERFTPQQVDLLGYSRAELEPFIQIIRELCQNPRKHHPETFERFSQRYIELFEKVDKRFQARRLQLLKE
ncbi:hypothetical protein LTR47_010866 [Exophiala xenobiotica]|nr:hypothetical protein LTR92_011113 [Exophiala xenobiotica]KAK5202811.1 hypothetical protein LTR41_011441 [Exophiala xenobiotica]KAK5215697.1 hypothetical protein LTR72_011251 [Exophiala xenobiotica]KAK5221577.1 hypothetical protein LTR47_010866 [Exophiala xenobiotica]KAK5245444.1 hypothetical protein LTS06_009113 [Exophiala xenobiotica]